METLSAHPRPDFPPLAGMQKQHARNSNAVASAAPAASRSSMTSNKQQQQQQQQSIPTPPPSQPQNHYNAVPGNQSSGFRSYASSAHATNSQDSLNLSMTRTTTTNDSGTAPRLLTASTTLSQTSLNTDLTSPTSSRSQTKSDSLNECWSPLDGSTKLKPSTTVNRLRTPENQTDGGATSPTNLTSPTRHKRTASGMVKTAAPLVESPTARQRAESVSSSGSKAGDAAAQLKTRLAYAMAKVQHGWEHRNIDEVEQLAASLPTRTNTVSSPATAVAAAAARALVSPKSALTNGAARLSMQDITNGHFSDPTSPPSKRRSGAGLVTWSGQPTIIPSPKTNRHQPSLAPPLDLAPTTSQQHRRKPSDSSASTAKPTTSFSPPQFPSTPKSRPSALRTVTQTQQAEQDAMDALMLMGSPSNNGKFPSNSASQLSASSSQQQQQQQALAARRQSHSNSQGSSLQPSPLRSEFPQAANRGIRARTYSSDSQASSSLGRGSSIASEVREAREAILDEIEEGKV